MLNGCAADRSIRQAQATEWPVRRRRRRRLLRCDDHCKLPPTVSCMVLLAVIDMDMLASSALRSTWATGWMVKTHPGDARVQAFGRPHAAALRSIARVQEPQPEAPAHLVPQLALYCCSLTCLHSAPVVQRDAGPAVLLRLAAVHGRMHGAPCMEGCARLASRANAAYSPL